MKDKILYGNYFKYFRKLRIKMTLELMTQPEKGSIDPPDRVATGMLEPDDNGPKIPNTPRPDKKFTAFREKPDISSCIIGIIGGLVGVSLVYYLERDSQNIGYYTKVLECFAGGGVGGAIGYKMSSLVRNYLNR